MINEKNVEKAKQLIKKSEKPIIVSAQDDHFNRKILEYGKFDILLGVENAKSKDSIRQIDSGFNHVLARIAAKNKVSLGIDIVYLRGLGKKERAIELEKIRQNIKICRKAGVKIKALNYREEKDVSGLFESLGASTKQGSEAISF